MEVVKWLLALSQSEIRIWPEGTLKDSPSFTCLRRELSRKTCPPDMKTVSLYLRICRLHYFIIWINAIASVTF